MGIDQTGAVRKNGEPYPLVAAVLASERLHLVRLATLSGDELKRKLEINSLENLEIIVDCVLGLPRAVDTPFQQALHRAWFELSYGRVAAQKFFRSLRPASTKDFRREVEVLCNAHSVFQEYPFQRNIQTGTFRFWKDLGSGPAWYALRSQGEKSKKGCAHLHEGYPSLAWKNLFAVKNRKPAELPTLIRKFFPAIKLSMRVANEIKSDPNVADSVVLALAGYHWLEQRKYRYPPGIQKEGWILGAGRE